MRKNSGKSLGTKWKIQDLCWLLAPRIYLRHGSLSSCIIVNFYIFLRLSRKAGQAMLAWVIVHQGRRTVQASLSNPQHRVPRLPNAGLFRQET